MQDYKNVLGTNQEDSNFPRRKLHFVIIVCAAILVFGVVLITGLMGETRAFAQEGDNPTSVPQDIQVFKSSGTMSFQGELRDKTSGNPLPDGSYKMRFAIYDAASGGNRHWPTPSPDYEEQLNVSVTGGLFNIFLGSEINIPTSVFHDGGDRYLQIWVCQTAGAGCSTFDDVGRLPISSAGYALGLVPGAMIYSDIGFALKGIATTTYGSALEGEASANSGNAAGVYGSSYSPGGAGISGYNNTSGYGVYGSSWSGTGLYGATSSASGYGVYSKGNAHIEGNLTWITKTGYIAVPAASFIPITNRGGMQFERFFRAADGSALAEYGTAGIQLPHGAKVTKLTFFWNDHSATDIGYATLARHDFTGNVVSLGSAQTNDTTPNIPSSSDHTFNSTYIDNTTYSYSIRLTMSDDASGFFNILVYGVIIEYEYTEPY